MAILTQSKIYRDGIDPVAGQDITDTQDTAINANNNATTALANSQTAVTTSQTALGMGIEGIAKTGTTGLVDTYTISLVNGTTFELTVTNGNGITGIAKTGTAGLVDTYTVSLSDGTSTTFEVTNGAKGDKGDTGATPNIAVSATTLPAGSEATATVSGTAENPTITFGIPQGQQGQSGEIYQTTGTSTTGAMSQKATTDELAKITNMPIGMIFPSAVALNDARFYLLDGGTISTTGIYSEFVALLNTLYPNGDYTQQRYTKDIDNYGQCGHFVIGTDTIRLPKITKFIEGLSNISDLGKSYGAGLPNITGSMTFMTNCRFPLSSTEHLGALSHITSSVGNYLSRSSDTASGNVGISFNASNSNSIYGNSTTVQPQSTAFPYYIVLANEYKTPVQVNLDNFATELNNKADKTLSNVTYPSINLGATTTGTGDRVIQQYISSDGLTWYRKWASGWKECGVSISSSTTTSTFTTITLPITFTNTNYNVTSSGYNSSYQIAVRCRIDSTSTIGVSAGVQGSGYYNSTIRIYCCGY